MIRSLVILFLFPCLAMAHEHIRQHAAHEHGLAQLNIVLAELHLVLELDSPAYNLLGFEHQPKTTEQEQLVTTTLAKLQQNIDLLQIDAEANCILQYVQTDNPFDDHGHDKHDTHTDIKLEYHYDCDINPQFVQTAQLFAQFPNFQRLNVQLINDKQQSAKILTADDTLVNIFE